MSSRLKVVWAIVALFSTCRGADFDAAAAVNQVGLDLYRQLAPDHPDTNLVISPYSIEGALALAYVGADGATRDELATALHFPRYESELRPALAALRTALANVAANSAKIADTRNRAEPTAYAIVGSKRVELAGEPPEGITWHEANRLFAQSGYAFHDSYLSLMRDGYAAPLEQFDFKHDPAKALYAINHWVEEQTQGKIPDLIPRGGVNEYTRLVLVNALYLKAPWETPFEPTLTTAEPFHLSHDNTADVQTMRRGGHMGYAHENGLTVVALDYLGRELQCLILLPDEGTSADAVAANFKPDDFAHWAKLGKDARPSLIILHLPRFKIKGTTLPLGIALRQLGVKRTFDEPRGSADFTRIAPRRPDDYLKFSEVYHQTFVELDEKGTEAAAATAVVMMTMGAADPTNPIEVRVDRPFLFAIQHRASGACLFLGRVTDPR